MGALAFWKVVVQDRSNFLDRVIEMLEAEGIEYCVVGGVAVNAYAEPVITQDLDIVVATNDVERAKRLFELHFKVREFDFSYNVYEPDSGLQVQLQLRPELAEVLTRAERREVLGLSLPVAAPPDLVDAKVAAATEPRRRTSKRAKEILDLARLVMAYPELAERIPDALRTRVMEAVDD